MLGGGWTNTKLRVVRENWEACFGVMFTGWVAVLLTLGGGSPSNTKYSPVGAKASPVGDGAYVPSFLSSNKRK